MLQGERNARNIGLSSTSHLNWYSSLLHKQECFTGKYTTCKTHTKLHPGPEWRIFHFLTSEDIDDVISRFFTFFLKNTLLSTSEQYISLIILLYDTTLQNKKEAYLTIVTYTTTSYTTCNTVNTGTNSYTVTCNTILITYNTCILTSDGTNDVYNTYDAFKTTNFNKLHTYTLLAGTWQPCKQSLKNGERKICLYNKKKIKRWLEDMNFNFRV